MSLRMGAHSLCWVVLVAFALNYASALSNLDVSEPIVRTSPATNDDDNFGFSVVMHQVEVPVPGDFESFISNTRLIVGAPLGTYPGGLQGLPALDPVPLTGLVYQCPVNAPGNCAGLNSSTNDDNARRMFDGDPNLGLPDPENKSEQLMGSSLHSNGQYFIACAPRWVFNPVTFDIDGRRPIGRCYVSQRNLEEFRLIMPCTGAREASPESSLNSDNHCLSGFSASFLREGSQSVLALGVVGDVLFNGNIYYYNLTGPMPSLTARTSAVRSTRITNLYDGYSTTSGFITNTGTEDFISGVPRFDGTVLTGSVRVWAAVNFSATALNVTGEQTGEYFGYSVAAADLNNDGFDELIVGAPLYSTDSVQEPGRVYVYENLRGTLSGEPIMLYGRELPLARFGSSIINLEDVNGDGFQDIGIGSPYELNDAGNTGAVYIYYGNNGNSSSNGLISRSPDQTILAQDIVNAVPNLQSLRTFGFSLFSGVDVDGNEVNDLLIGAYESKTAVLIRSLSVAYVTISISTAEPTVSIDTTGNQGSKILVTVCASYRGRGLDGRALNTSLSLSEEVSNDVARLFFEEGDPNSLNRLSTAFMFPTTNQTTCVNVPVFVKPVSSIIGQVDLLSPLEVRAEFQSLPRRPVSYVAGDPVDLIDYRSIPIITTEGNSVASVMPSVNCSRDANGQEVCQPDLIVTLLNITYIDSQNNPRPENQAIAEAAQSVNISLEYQNIGPDPAFGSLIAFNVPAGISFLRVASNPLISCAAISSSLFNCDLPNYIPPSTKGIPFTLVWRLPEVIRGNEPTGISNLNISLVSRRDSETNSSNNELINGPIRIEYSAASDLELRTLMFTRSPTTYQGIAPLQPNPRVDQIGQEVQLSVRVVNNGPSTTVRASLDIFIPTNDAGSNLYYLYLFDYSQSGSGQISCEGPFNPQDLPPPSDSRRRRRKRQGWRMPRQSSPGSDVTPAPQAGTSVPTEIRNCSSQQGRPMCARVQCVIQILPIRQSTTILINAYLDERFFEMVMNPYEFVVFANVSNDENFFDDPNLQNNFQASGTYRVILAVVDTGNFPIWIPIVCGVVAVILIVILFVILYFVGFFRRKRHEDTKEAEGDFEPPQDANGKQPSPEKPKLTEAPVEPPTEPPIEPAGEDIGDTQDLEDSTEKPEKDPEETSL